MTLSFALSETRPGDKAQLRDLYAAAFPQEDLLALVEALLADDSVLSISATSETVLIGHVLFTRGRLEGASEAVALLGPLAVHPAHQRKGSARR